jgi:DNA-directed RNA polymerase subunit RPC12/RpoP
MEKKYLIMAVLIIVGIIILGIAATADYTGMNVTQDNQDDKVFGWVQIVGCCVGGLVILVGIAVNWIYKPAPEEEEEDEDEEAEEYECPTCGAAVAADAVECGECGELFEADEGMPEDEDLPDDDEEPDMEEEPDMGEDEEDEDEEGEVYECPTCGGEVGEDDAVCPHCGEEFE